MKSVSLASDKHLAATSKPGVFSGLAKTILLKQLERLEYGCINLTDGQDSNRFGQTSEEAELTSNIDVINRSFYADIVFGGTIGAGEAYMNGSWQCENLVNLVRILLQNRHVLDNMERGTASLTRPLQKMFHWINRNTRDGARRNISAHYDLGNEFFKLFLYNKQQLY